VLERMASQFPVGKMTNAPTVSELKQSMQFILRADTKGTSGTSKRSSNKALKPLWNLKKLAVGDHFSSISYLKVDKIEGDKITVMNALGGSWIMSKDLLVRDAWAADHFKQEVKTTMTELANILAQCRETIFNVNFKKKVDLKDVEAKLGSINMKDDKEIKALSKSVTDGDECTITGYLTEIENDLGRSLVIDLNANPKSNFRQVDHRTINWIIFKNVKYSVGKKTHTEELPLKAESGVDKWDSSKLALKNWFSATSYYSLTSIVDKNNVQVKETRNSSDLQMATDILNTEMNSGLVYDKEEKTTRADVIDKIKFAGECVMTVNFNKKVDHEHIKSVVDSSPKKTDLKKLSKEIITGKEVEMTCYMLKTENNLGRSLVMDLNAPHGKNFR